jgi:TP901 family phage tail tape measure protein
MANTETRHVEIILQAQRSDATLKDLEKSSRALSAQLKKLPMDSKEFADKTKELAIVNTRLNAIKADCKSVGGAFQQIAKEVKSFGIIAIAAMAFGAISGKIGDVIQQNAKLSDSFADIQKTTGMTKREVENLNKAFGQMNTRTATKDLRDIAIAAGQLGISKNQVLAFTAATDKMVVALGDEFKGGAEEVSKVMGGLRNVFTDLKTENVADDMLHIGNAINELGATGAATGPVVADFANRIGGVGITLGLTSGQVLGLSARMQELNINSERGGTAVTRILQKMTTNTAEFAKVAQMDVQKFTDLVNNDLYGAFIKVVEGSKQGGTSATAFSAILDKLGVDGAGASEVFAKLGSNTELLDKRVKLASKSLGETSSIMNEFNIKNETFGAKLDKLSKSFTASFANSAVMHGMEAMVDGLLKITDNTEKVSESLGNERKALMMAETEIYSYNVGNENRTKLIDQLKEQYPEYLGNIDSETVSNEKLHTVLDKVNSSLINKIILQKKDEEIQELADVAAEKKLESTEARIKLIEKLTEVYGSNAAALKMQKEMEGLPVDFAAEQMLKPENFRKAGLSQYNEGILELSKSLKNWKSAEIEANAASIPLNDVLNDKTELMKQLGIQTTESAKASKETVHALVEVNKKELDEFQKILDEIKRMERDHELARLDGNTREIKQIEDKYEELRRRAKGHAAAIKRIDALENDDLFEALLNQGVKEAAAEAKIYNDKLARLKKLQIDKDKIQNSAKGTKNLSESDKAKEETRLLTKEWDDRIKEAEEHNGKLYAGEEEFFIDVEALTIMKNASIEALTNTHNEKILASDKKLNQQRLQMAEQMWGQLSSIISSFNTVQNNSDNRELSKYKQRNDQKKAHYKRLLDSKVISEKDYNQKVNKIQEQQDAQELEIKKRQAKREKQAAIVTAIVNTALAVLKANSAAAPPYNYVLMALAAAVGAAQIAAISSQPEAYAKGGKTANKFQTGGHVSEPHIAIAGEAGPEWIAPNWMMRVPALANQINNLEAIRLRGYYSGGYSQKEHGNNFQDRYISSQPQMDLSVLKGISDTMNRLNEHLDGGIKGVWDWDYDKKSRDKINSAKSVARVG